MFKVIQPGEGYKDKLKYVLINPKQKVCKVILNDKDGKEEIKQNIDDLLTDYSIDYNYNLTIKEELEMIWPQLVKEFNNKFSYSKSWFERAELIFEDQKIIISLETRLAAKKIDNPRVVNFIQNRIYYYLDQELDVKIKNGDFFKNDKSIEESLKKQKAAESKKRSTKRKNAKKIICGSRINKSQKTDLENIKSEQKSIVTSGIVFNQEVKQLRKNLNLHTFYITNYKDSLTCKAFLRNGKNLNIKKDMKVLVKGNIEYDKYSKDLILMVDDVNKIGEKKKRVDDFDEKRLELHLHTKMSAMDSTVDIKQAVKRASKWGHQAIAITDHGIVQSFPDAYQAGKDYGVDIIFGLEAYLIDNGKPIVVNPIDKKINEQEFVVFDLETTGLNPVKNETIEIGAVKIKDGEIIDEFSSLIKPKNKIPKKITEITGIDDSMVRDSKRFDQVFNDFVEFIKDAPLVAHNIDFDFSFIREALDQYINAKDVTLIDTLTLSRAVLPKLKNHKLANLVEYFDIDLTDHHRALDDSKATAELFTKLIKEDEQVQLTNINEINELTKNIDWKKQRPYHALVLAKNQAGLKDIYKLVSKAHLENFYRKPRILKSELLACRENILIGSACESGQLFSYLLNNRSKEEIDDIIKFYDFLEIQPLGNNEFLIQNQLDNKEELKSINKEIYKLGQEHDIPVVGTGDVHFLDPKDKIYRKILQAGQGYDDYEKQAPLYYRTTEEMLAEFDYFDEQKAKKLVIENPKKIYQMIDEDIKPIPEGLYTPEIAGADEKIRNLSYQKAKKLYGENLPDFIEKRLKKELDSIINNGYSVIYLIAHKLVKQSLEDGYLVGSRGSVGSSFVATMCDITEVNPLPSHYRCPDCNNVEIIEDDKYSTGVDLPDKKCPECNSEYIKDGFDIPFEVFMGFKGDKVPDIDLNFSGEYQNTIHEVTEEFFGRDYVFRAGTISTIADRTAFGFVKNYLDDNDIEVKKAEINRLVAGCAGVKKTTGQHPGGLMVVPKSKDIYDFTPIQHPANDQDTRVRTTHFDYHSISGRILKLDLLGHDDPTSLKMLEDLTGVDPEKIPLDDPETMKIFSSTEGLGVQKEAINSEVGTFGIPEFGTSFVRQMLIDTRPSTFAELVRISGLSHGTDVWLNNAQKLIKDNKANLSEVISVRDDIMNFLVQKGMDPSDAFWIMEHVRKGKGLTEDEEKKMRENGVPDWYIKSCKKIKYMFPKAHAAAYVMMAFRIAYFKVHYPEAFYLTYFSTKAKAFDAQIIDKGLEYIRDYLKNLNNQDKLTAKDKETITILEVVIEAIERGVEFGKVDLYSSKKGDFILKDDKLIPPLICLEGLGSSAASSIIEARKNGKFISIEDLTNQTSLSKTVIEKMKEHGTLTGLPDKNQLELF